MGDSNLDKAATAVMTTKDSFPFKGMADDSPALGLWRPSHVEHGSE
jgi:hypothetical protein